SPAPHGLLDGASSQACQESKRLGGLRVVACLRAITRLGLGKHPSTLGAVATLVYQEISQRRVTSGHLIEYARLEESIGEHAARACPFLRSEHVLWRERERYSQALAQARLGNVQVAA